MAREDDDAALAARLEKLRQELPPRAPVASEIETGPANRSSFAQAFKLSSEFIAGILVGIALGYVFDLVFGTSPWGLIVFLLLGFGAAILNVLRASGSIAESKLRQNGAVAPVDEQGKT